MKDKLANYSYLWEDEPKRYVIIRTIMGSQDLETCLVYDLQTKTALLEEDDDVYREIKRHLAEKGVPMVTTIPK